MTRVLIVDDEADIRSLFKLALRREGLKVIEARSGWEALALVEAEPPDLVLLDIMMPDMNGYEVCRRLRADSRTAHIPILVLTARTNLAERRNALLCGANDFLVKTAGPRRLIERVRSLLGHNSPMSVPQPHA